MAHSPGGRDDSTARQKRTVSVTLRGQRFSFRSGDDQEYIERVARYVNTKLDQIQQATGRVETGQIALLAALDIADDLFRQKGCDERLRREVESRGNALLGAIDRIQSELDERQAVAVARAPAAGRATER